MKIVRLSGYPGYGVSRDGFVWSEKTGEWKRLKPFCLKKCGHLIVGIFHRHGKRHKRHVAHLILETFVGLRPVGKECCHNNGDPSDNRVENLRWDTRSANQRDRNNHHNGQPWFRGSKNPVAKLTEAKVRKIRQMCQQGRRQRDAAKQFGVSQRTVWNILHRLAWKHV